MKNLGMGEVSSQNAVGIYVENRKMRTGIKIEVYSSGDEEEIIKLLSQAGLPTEDLNPFLCGFSFQTVPMPKKLMPIIDSQYQLS